VSRFSKVARVTTDATGQPIALVITLVVTGAWIAWGLLYTFSDGMMSWMGAVTGIVSIILLVLNQNGATRDAHAIHLKLDGLIGGIEGVRDDLQGIEALEQEELDKLAAHTEAHQA
jgi:low affinity Fe/Cu permease